MKKVLVWITRMILISMAAVFFASCPAVPREWTEAVIIEEFTLSDSAPYDVYVYVDGYSPFNWEVYTNPLFEGEPAKLGTKYENTITISGLTPGNNFYLRIKSQYGEWTTYTDNQNEPIPISYSYPSYDAGDVPNPHFINNKADLIAVMNQDESRYPIPDSKIFGDMSFLLTADIDLTGVDWKPIGNSPTTPYSGTFNGGGYVISGLNSLNTDDISGSPLSAGFFGNLGSNSTVKNLGLKIGNITCTTNIDFLGGLAGCGPLSGNVCTISSCFVTGEKIGETAPSNEFVGGFIGGGTVNIENSYCDITVEGSGNLGGFIGNSFVTSTIRNCYAAGDLLYTGLPGSQYSGGFSGYNVSGSTITDCIALNKRLTSESTGYLGYYFFGSVVSTLSYYNKNIYCPEGSSFSDVGFYSIPVNPYTMGQSTPPFNSWNFAKDWKWDDSVNRPVLRKVKQ